MGEQRLAVEYRGGIEENIHSGHLCVVDENGNVRAQVGDPMHLTLLRSSAKPFQAIASLLSGIAEKFALTDRELAILAGSHRGEAIHLETVQGILDKLQLDSEQLVCGHAVPLHEASRKRYREQGLSPSKLCHNCSGKHSGLLAMCLAEGWDIEHYHSPDHPAAARIISVLSYLSEYPAEQITFGIDGCGLPVYALPLKHIAIAYGKLANPQRIADLSIRQAAERLVGAMRAFPEMIAGQAFICSELQADANLVAKGGAQGVYGLGMTQEGLGVALKVTSGSEEMWPVIISHLLQQLDYANKETIARIHDIFPAEIRNSNQHIVGERKAVFSLSHISH